MSCFLFRRRWSANLLIFLITFAAALPSRADIPGHGAVINELHVDPDPKTSPVEFIELHNRGAAALDLAGWSFSDGVQYTFPTGASLPAGGYVVVAGNPGAVAAEFGLTGVFGPWTGKLSNEGETVTLRDAAGLKADEVSYRIGFPWPTVGDAPSYSMELLNPALDNDLGGHWRSSTGAITGPTTLLAAGASDWKYIKGTAEPASGWRTPGFDDSAWSAATLPVGYGEPEIPTHLSDMVNNYTTVYLRRTFTVADAGQVGQLLAQIRYDDGFNLWINSVHVLSNNVSNAELAHTATATLSREDNSTVAFALPDPAGYLQTGANTMAVQLLNQRLSSGDCYLNLALVTGEGAEAGPTPGAVNSIYTTQAPTALRQVKHAPAQPAAGEIVTVTAKATDPDGVAAMVLEYQVVEPGAYIRLTDAAYFTSANWTALAMTDNGAGGDAAANDAVFTAQIPASVQAHRRLVRYRIRATDGTGEVTPAPCADDPVPNFAYFVYNGVPAWQGALRPGYTPTLTFPAAALTNIPVYHLIADNTDVVNCQYNSAYNDDVYRWYGTLVYNGRVYDHIGYRIRGSASTYTTGKNKWKFRFRTGHDFEAVDEDGTPYPYKWENLTLSALMCPWWANDASTGGTILNETAAMTLYRLAGVPAIRSHFFHYRIIDDAAEASPASQYEGDFWGLYLAIEETEADYLEANGLPDGNLYNCNGSVGASVKRNQGPTAVQDFSDFSAEMSYTTGHHKANPYQPYAYWTNNIALDNYYRFNAVNHLVNNTDMYLGSTSIERNMVYYRNPDTGLWWPLPWDLDLTFESAPHLGHPDTEWEHFWYVFSHAAADIAYQNVVREVSDLLVRNGDAVKAIEAAAARLCPFAGGMPVSANGWPQANQALWDYHPRANKPGIFYDNMGAVSDFTGYYNYLKTYVTAAGYGGAAVEAKLTLTGVPNTPTVTYRGAAGYPTDDLRFRLSAFSDTDGGTFAGLQWRIAEITPTDAPGYPAVDGGIRYEIDAGWTSESAVYAADVQIPFEIARLGRTYRVRARMKDDTGHWSRWSAPVEFSPSAPSYVPASAANLRITELHYNPIDDLALDYVELRNVGGGPINLAGATFDAGIAFTFGDWTLAAGEFVLVVQDLAAFEGYFGAGRPVAGVFTGKLDGAGEQVRLMDATGVPIMDVTYDDKGDWPGRADGEGSSIELVDFAVPNDGRSWRSSSEFGGSPGYAGAGPVDDILVNEVLPAGSPPQGGWIELFNTTDTGIDLGGWYLSNGSGITTTDGYRRFRIPDGTVAPARGYVVFDEADFNNPASPTAFAFSSSGDEVHLLATDAAGKLLRFMDDETVGAAPAGRSLGRWPNGVGTRLYPLSTPTCAAENAAPWVGPVVLTEIQYNPGPYGIEFLELYNRTAEEVALTGWTLDGVTYAFPEPATLAPHAAVVLVGFDPGTNLTSLAAFQAAYGDVTPVGPWTGALDNSGEAVTAFDASGHESDRVKYSPDAPWPTAADGTGRSLQRINPDAWGDTPANWTALAPTAGLLLADPAYQAWREEHFTPGQLADPAVSGDAADPDQDGVANGGEYAGDTDPWDPASRLWLTILQASNDEVALGFPSSARRSYRVETASALIQPDWAPAEDAPLPGSGGWMEYIEPLPFPPKRLYYRITASPEPVP